MPEEKIRAKDLLNQLLDQHYEEAWEAKRQGKPVGWASSNFPQEFLETLGLTVCYPENHSTSLSAKHESMDMIQEAERLGFSNDLCGYARVNLGFVSKGDCESLRMPLPDYLVCTNNICNQLVKWFETVAKLLDIPLIVYDIPFNNEYEVSESRMEYMRRQIPELIAQLEQVTGAKWDDDRFREVMEISNQCGREWQRASRCFESNPSPMNGFEMFNYMALMVCARGRKETARAIGLLADELEENCRKGVTTFRGEPKHRVMMEGIACWPWLRVTSTALKSRGINMVTTIYADAFGFIYDDFDSMIRAYCRVPNAINLELSRDKRVKLCRDNHVEGLLVHTNRSCKLWSGFMPEMSRQIGAECGIPVVSFDGDQADPRNFSEAQYDTRVQALMEIMDSRKEAGV